MFTSEIKIRVRYAETDKMGYVYHGQYASYFEVARVEALRNLGLSYKEMEENGIMLPVYEMSTKFLKPAYYDDLLTIKSTVKEIPNVRLNFEYETFNEMGEFLNSGKTILVFFKASTKKPCTAPDWFMEKLHPYFS